MPAPAPAASVQPPAKLHLLIKLPPFTVPRSEPLLSSGQTGRGDLIYIRYVDATHFQIGHDRWGYGGTLGPVVEYNPDIPLDLDISCPPLLGPGAPARLTVRLNSQPVLDAEEAFYPSRPEEIEVGRNRIGASTAEAAFTGNTVVAEWLEP